VRRPGGEPEGRLRGSKLLLTAATGLVGSWLLPWLLGDGHLEMIPRMAPRLGLHPAHTYSVAHHRDVMTAVAIALDGFRPTVPTIYAAAHEGIL